MISLTMLLAFASTSPGQPLASYLWLRLAGSTTTARFWYRLKTPKHSDSRTIEGEEKVTLQMIDGEIKDGKVERFFVYAATPPAREAAAE